MEERLKQRLVGAIVLVSLAVVFVPILFDAPRELNEESSPAPVVEIPERPRDGFESPAGNTVEAPETPRLDAEMERERNRQASIPAASEAAGPDSVSPSSVTTVSISLPRASEPPAPAPASRSGPSPERSSPAPAAGPSDDASGRKQVVEAPAATSGGWMVQLGSFRKPENALALRKRLQAGGYPAFVESGPSAQGAVSRVFVGPIPGHEQAKDSAEKLRREMALEGIVVPYSGG